HERREAEDNDEPESVAPAERGADDAGCERDQREEPHPEPFDAVVAVLGDGAVVRRIPCEQALVRVEAGAGLGHVPVVDEVAGEAEGAEGDRARGEPRRERDREVAPERTVAHSYIPSVPGTGSGRRVRRTCRCRAAPARAPPD